VNIENLFDHQTVTRRFQVVNRDTFNVTDQVFFSGTFDPIALQAANPATYRPDPRFRQADQWQQPRELRVQVRYTF
jgi:hypothetical protein